jgi:hypothetical protein
LTLIPRRSLFDRHESVTLLVGLALESRQ